MGNWRSSQSTILFADWQFFHKYASQMFLILKLPFSPTDTPNKREATVPLDPLAALQRRGTLRTSAAPPGVQVLSLQRGSV